MDETVGAPIQLIERDADLERIERLMERAAGGAGTLLLIEGAAGAGKTALLQNAVRIGRRRGMDALETAGSELERDLGFGVVRGLFERRLVDTTAANRRTLLSGAASLAGQVALPKQGVGPADPASVLHGLFWLVSNLAERGPLMLAVDDAHWADPPSLRFLAYLARRLAGLPVLLVIATRPREPGANAEFVSALSAAGASDVLVPQALSEEAVGRLIAERVATVPALEFVAACHLASGGNPFLVRELITALSSDGIAPTADNAGRMSRIGPQSVSRTVLARVARVGQDAAALTEAVAVLGGAELRHASALAGLSNDAAARASDALAQIGVLRASRPLQFVHPLVHTAIYEAIPPGRRSLAHSAAARLMAQEGAGPDRMALHLLHTEPAGEPWVVEALLGAAAASSARGAPEQSASYLRRALDEPPGPGERAAVLHRLGAAELLAREEAATQHLAHALDATSDPALRGEIALLLGRAAVSGGRLAQARELLEPLIDELGPAQPEVVARLEAYRAASLVWGSRYSDQVQRELPRLRALAETTGPAGRSLLLMIAFRYAQMGMPPAEQLELVERGLDDGRFVESESAESIEVTWASRVLLFADELDRADRLFDLMALDSRKRGSVMGYATTSAWRADLALRQGSISTAEAEARSAMDLAAAHGLHFISPYALSFLGDALIEQGELDAATQLFEHADLGPMRESGQAGRFLHARARLHLARGERQAALTLMQSWGPPRPEPWVQNPNALAWRSTLALALPESAHGQAIDLVESELKEARRVGLPRAVGVALRARGHLSKGLEQISLFREALERFEASPSRLERARTLTDLGASLRRTSHRTEAREVLTQALDMASACGAQALVRRAREELIAAGARPRRERVTGVESLTPSERRVAMMAASGMTNREIAQALFVTIKAVALHLTRVYEKLEIAGRAQLPELLGRASTDSR
jgi:DNA-binding CsgD family transcriptional regulator